MKFKVLRESYLFGELKQEGEVFDYPDEHLPLDGDGNIRFDKLPQLELIGPKPELKAPKAKASTPAGKPAQEPDETEKESDEDDGKPKPPTPEQKAESIRLALPALDPAKDDHWNKTDGKPSVKEVSEIVGYTVTRGEIDAVDEAFVRPTE